MKFSDISKLIDDGRHGDPLKQSGNRKTETKMLTATILAPVLLILLVFPAGCLAGIWFRQAAAGAADLSGMPGTAGAAWLPAATFALTGLSVFFCILYIRAMYRFIRRIQYAAQNLAAGKTEKISMACSNGSLDGPAEELNSIGQSVLKIMDDANMLRLAVENGDMSVRADTEKYQGIYRGIVKEINVILDTAASPAREMAQKIRQISEGGCFNTGITGDFFGDFRIIQESVNELTENTVAFVQDLAAIACVLREGRFSARTDSGRHRGVLYLNEKKHAYCELVKVEDVTLIGSAIAGLTN